MSGQALSPKRRGLGGMVAGTALMAALCLAPSSASAQTASKDSAPPIPPGQGALRPQALCDAMTALMESMASEKISEKETSGAKATAPDTSKAKTNPWGGKPDSAADAEVKKQAAQRGDLVISGSDC